ncbi:MAG: NADH-quinone oxidoreductase subunit NuoB [Oscillospiraceae bacterium]|nr:NADH-quinone oxidoreductase subunit NuoB [Oscillospiraceae bacterium]
MFQKTIIESTGKSPWLFHINAGSCNGCDIEIVSVLTPRYDAERVGFKLVGSPRHADIAVVSGPVTKQSLPRVLRTLEQIPEPRCIVTCGSCPQSGNVFRDSYSVAGPLSKYVHVDVDIAGCSPKPEAIMDGLLLAAKILEEKRKTGNMEATLPNPYVPVKAEEAKPAEAAAEKAEEKAETKGEEK